MKKLKRKTTLIVLCSKAVPKEADRDMQVFFYILYFWNTQQKRGEISVRQFQYRYKQIGMRSVELIWQCSILAKKCRARSCTRPFN